MGMGSFAVILVGFYWSLGVQHGHSFVPPGGSVPHRLPTTFVFTSTSDDIASMRVSEIKKELESYGLPTRIYLEKKELVEALEKARADGLQPKASATTTTTSTSNTASSSASSSSPSPSPPTDTRPRDERLKEEMEKCQAMKAGELKKELEERGVSTKSFFEKSEFVQALAEARVDGVEKKSKENYAEYSNVEVLTADDAGPRPKQREQSQQQQRQSPFGGSPFGGAGGANPFGGAAGANPFGGMGGMGGMADILKNMGGAAAGGAAGNPFGGMGGMGGMGDVMGKAQEMMKNPKVMELMAKAQQNPKMMKAMQECMGNPAAFAKYQNDPEVADFVKELQKYI